MDKYRIKELIGDCLEGIETGPDSRELLERALQGPLATDQGLQRVYIDLETLLLEHVDLCEAIWSLGEAETYAGDESDIVFFDELGNVQALRSRISAREDGREIWACLELKVLGRLRGKTT